MSDLLLKSAGEREPLQASFSDAANPIGLDGIEFIEFATAKPQAASQSLRDIKAKFGAPGKREDATQQAKAGEKTDFSELTASFKIANGVAHNDDLSMKSPFLRLAGAGDIDIGGGQMNYLAKASVVASSAGQGGQGLEQLKGLTVPVRLSGPFESLSYKIEFGSLVSDAAKAKVEEKTQEVKAKAEDKVKDKLKGLFGK